MSRFLKVYSIRTFYFNEGLVDKEKHYYLPRADYYALPAFNIDTIGIVRNRATLFKEKGT